MKEKIILALLALATCAVCGVSIYYLMQIISKIANVGCIPDYVSGILGAACGIIFPPIAAVLVYRQIKKPSA